MDYLGGDKPAATITRTDSKEAIAYKEALVDLIKTVSIVHFMGQKPEDIQLKPN